MKTSASPIDRLLHSAAMVPHDPPAAIPFGFDTRLIALWRATWTGDPVGIAHLLRRVMFIAVTLIVLASAGEWRELSQGDDGESSGDGFALADSAIGGAFDQ